MNIIALCSDQNMLIVRIYEGCKDDERKISEGRAKAGKTLKAIDDARNIRGVTKCNSFEEYLEAVSE